MVFGVCTDPLLVIDSSFEQNVCLCVQEKQNEARYLRDHKEELIEELATTIVQKVGRVCFIMNVYFPLVYRSVKCS